jgi:hypothetical protein
LDDKPVSLKINLTLELDADQAMALAAFLARISPQVTPGSLPTPEQRSPWLTLDQVAEYCQRHPVTVGRAMRKGLMRATQYEKNGSWRAHIDDVDTWMRGEAPVRGKRKPPPATGKSARQ